ncbi:MAG: pyrroline-5-carboxylate reductase [candidate division Zixibacteria bacterium]|nr:pyrroline-5-carboxylate reductase [candidate division Zixibacteria bacterium]
MFSKRIAILGGGNIGRALANGFVRSGNYKPSQIYITRRQTKFLDKYKKQGFHITSDNLEAINNCKTIIISVLPAQLTNLLDSVKHVIQPKKHNIISVITGVKSQDISDRLKSSVPVILAMPNTAVSIGESMTCLAGNGFPKKALNSAIKLFDNIGKTIVVKEEHMIASTALCACGIAFFLRAIRAASQGGIQIGFHAEDALKMAAQTARGAATLLLESEAHPESEIDRVTTPLGCTIAGLNMMEHEGFSSAMIKGLVTAGEKAESLFNNKKK